MKAAPVSISDIREQTFSTRSQHQANAIVVSMSGNADTAIHDRLKIFLDEVHETARAVRIKETVFEVRELYFMNSSCLSLFLRLINVVVESPSSQKYTLRFQSNPNLRWQKKSLQALASFAQDIVVVE
jgi:hypothetical protein